MASWPSCEGGGGGGGGIIWRPALATSPPFYQTLAEVSAQVALTFGISSVFLDPQGGGVFVVAAGEDLGGGFGALVVQAYDPNIPQILVTVEDGGRLNALAAVSNTIHFRFACRTVTPLVFLQGQLVRFDDGATLEMDATATIPACQVPAAGRLYWGMRRGVTLDNSAAPTVPVVRVAATGQLVFFATDNVNFTGTEIGGPVGSGFGYEHDQSCPTGDSLTLTNFAGSLGENPLDASTFDAVDDRENFRTNRAAQSPIDRTRSGATNLGSDTTSATVGVTADYATVGGGDQNIATAPGATVPGGVGNSATGIGATAAGEDCTAGGEGATAIGIGNVCPSDGQTAIGTGLSMDPGAISATCFGATMDVEAAALYGVCAGFDSIIGDEAACAIGEHLIIRGQASFGCGMLGTTSADQAFVSGNNCLGAGAQSRAGGLSSSATALCAWSYGEACHAIGPHAGVGGHNSNVEGDFSFVWGSGCDGGGSGVIVCGSGSSGAGNLAAVFGFLCTGGGVAAFSQGYNCDAAGQGASASGVMASAPREGQASRAAGVFAVVGDAQGSDLSLRGQTPGAAPGESVELMYGLLLDKFFELEDGKALTIDYRVTATSAGGDVASYKQTLLARQDAGLITQFQASPQTQLNSPGAAAWTFVASVAVAPERVSFVFTTDIRATDQVNVVCTLDWTESTSP